MRNLKLAFLVLLGLGIAASCSRDSPVEIPIQPVAVPLETAPDRQGPKLKLDDGALSIEAMLSDPLFQALVHGIEEPSLAKPLLAAVNALASSQTARAKVLLSAASAAADALEDDPASAEARIFWSAVEQFLKEAELV